MGRDEKRYLEVDLQALSLDELIELYCEGDPDEKLAEIAAHLHQKERDDLKAVMFDALVDPSPAHPASPEETPEETRDLPL
jgi:hypothetical protein